MIKTIVIDMDGTLLNDSEVMTSKTKEVLIDAQKQGIRIVLASGRTVGRMITHAKELQMDKYGGYLVFVNGTGIYDLSENKEERFYEMSVAHQVEVFNYFKDYPVEILSMRDDGALSYMSRSLFLSKVEEAKRLGFKDDVPLISDGSASIGSMKERGYIHLQYALDQDSFILPANKMALFGEPEIIIEAMENANNYFNGKYWIGRTMAKWCEIVLPEVNKAKALATLFSKIGANAHEAIAFGDGENDIDMLQYCGIGVAMGNALDTVKEAADQVTLSNNEDGVGDFIERLLQK